jgi:hypothetical protein
MSATLSSASVNNSIRNNIKINIKTNIKTKMDTKLATKEFSELVTDHMSPFDVVRNRMEVLSKELTTYGNCFNKMSSLCFPAVCFAFDHNIISPVQYVKKNNTFSFTLVDVIGSSWGGVLYKSNGALAKKLVVQLIGDLVKAGAATERCMIGVRHMEMVGAFAKQMRMTKRALSAVRIASKFDVELESVVIVLEKMGM